MAFPAAVFALGPVITWLGNAIGGLLSGLIAWFAASAAKRAAFLIIVAGVFSAVTITFFTFITNKIGQSIFGVGGVPAQFFSFASWVIDFQALAVMSGILIGVESAFVVVRWQVKLLDLKARI